MNENVPGPTCHALICTPRLEETVSAWCRYLSQHEHWRGRLGRAQAQQWQASELAGTTLVWLANALDEPWLCLVEDSAVADPQPFDAFKVQGWFSLEVGVQQVDALGEALRDSPFEILGPPADLDVSPDVRAMQVRGPAGEIVYLTEVRAEVPGFDLVQARCDVDRLFIPVMLTDDREQALSRWQCFPGLQPMRFETRITVLNRALGLPLPQRHPVVTMQLGGGNLIEMDQIPGLPPRRAASGRLPPGISMVGFEVASLDHLALPAAASDYRLAEGPFAGHRAALLRGHAGELIELIEMTESRPSVLEGVST